MRWQVADAQQHVDQPQPQPNRLLEEPVRQQAVLRPGLQRQLRQLQLKQDLLRTQMSGQQQQRMPINQWQVEQVRCQFNWF